NSANAKLCQKGGWQTLLTSDGKPFASEQDCVSYAAKGGTLKTQTPDLSVSPGDFTGTGSLGEKDYQYINPILGGGWTTTFTVTNSGTAASEHLTLIATLGSNLRFQNDNCSGNTLAPQGTCTFEVMMTAPCIADPGPGTNSSGSISIDGYVNSPTVDA